MKQFVSYQKKIFNSMNCCGQAYDNGSTCLDFAKECKLSFVTKTHKFFLYHALYTPWIDV